MKIVQSNDAPSAIGPYSQAVLSGGFIFCSGQICLKPDGSLLVGGIKEQTARVIENLSAVLKACGRDLSSVVKTTVYLSDMNHFAEMNAVYEQYFGLSKPARATVQVSRLPKDVLVEIDCIAESA